MYLNETNNSKSLMWLIRITIVVVYIAAINQCIFAMTGSNPIITAANTIQNEIRYANIQHKIDSRPELAVDADKYELICIDAYYEGIQVYQMDQELKDINPDTPIITKVYKSTGLPLTDARFTPIDRYESIFGKTYEFAITTFFYKYNDRIVQLQFYNQTLMSYADSAGEHKSDIETLSAIYDSYIADSDKALEYFETIKISEVVPNEKIAN